MPPEPVISWNYTACPPENECANGHHTCDALSETCVDRPDGFSCVCSDGYVLEGYVDGVNGAGRAGVLWGNGVRVFSRRTDVKS